MTASSSGSMASGGATPIVSIVLATFNERENLPALLERLGKVPLPRLEVLVVDDGSTDGTREYISQVARSDPRFRTVWHEGKQTTLRAQCQGIAQAKGRFVVVMDADLQHPPELLPSMVGALEGGAALVVASRYAPGGSAGKRSMVRAMISRGAEFLAKLLLPAARSVGDPVSGFFAFRTEIFRPLPPPWRGYKLLLFLLVMSHDHPVREVGFRFEPRGSGASKLTQNSLFIRFFLTELLLARRFDRALRHGAVPSTAAAVVSPPEHSEPPSRQQPL